MTARSPELLHPPPIRVRVGPEQRIVPEANDDLIALELDLARSEAGLARLVLHAPRDPGGRRPLQDGPLLTLWQPLQISVLLGHREQVLFDGYVVRVDVAQGTDNAPQTLTIQCLDALAKMDRLHRRRFWGSERATDDRTIVRTICREHGLALHPASERGATGLRVAQDETDVRFLQRRARINGYELRFTGGGVYFGPPQLEAVAAGTALVDAGSASNAFGFSLIDDGHRPTEVGVVRASPDTGARETLAARSDWPPLGREPAGADETGLAPFTWLVSGAVKTDLEVAAELAATARKHSLRIEAHLEIDTPIFGRIVQPGTTLAVQGVGLRHTGVYYVDRVEHRLHANSYTQRLTLLRNAYFDHLPPRASPRLSAVL